MGEKMLDDAKHATRKWTKMYVIVTSLVVLMAASVVVAVVVITVSFMTNIKDPDKSGHLTIADADGGVTREQIVQPNDEEIKFKSLSEGVVIYYDFKNKLEAVKFHNTDDCFVIRLNASEVERFTVLEESKEMAVPDTVATVWYTLTDVPADNLVQYANPSLKSACKKSFLVARGDKVASNGKRTKRSCGQSCIMVCTSRSNCRRRCYKNVCPPSNRPRWV